MTPIKHASIKEHDLLLTYQEFHYSNNFLKINLFYVEQLILLYNNAVRPSFITNVTTFITPYLSPWHWADFCLRPKSDQYINKDRRDNHFQNTKPKYTIKTQNSVAAKLQITNKVHYSE